jgi:serpin B
MTSQLFFAFALVSLTFLATGCSIDGPRPASGAANVGPVVEGNNRFALDLYGRLRSGQGNLFFSPGSISTALAMTYAGAAGSTEAEMARTLHFNLPPDRLHDAMSALQASWKTSDPKQGFHLQVANRLWGQEGRTFSPSFLELTRTKYGAEVARLDFARKPEAARQAINQWVEQQTADKIKDLIPSADVITNVWLVLTNAVYFKGDWSTRFDKNLTREGDFHVSATEKRKVALMHRQDRFRHAALDDLQVLELPYGDKSLSMVVILPQKVDGLADVEAKLTADNLKKWLSAGQVEPVVVYLPKFKTTSQFELSKTLATMGMPSAFDRDAADFTGMTGMRDLYISAVLHKAFVDVNEEGTEAAAATGVVMAPRSVPAKAKQLPVFRADHPFLFLIRDNRNGAILFLGRFVQPT